MLTKHECSSRFGVTKPGVKRALDNGIMAYFDEHDTVYFMVTFSLHTNPLIETKDKLLELGYYKRPKEGISPHCGDCKTVFGDECKDCPNLSARIKADNFIDVNCLSERNIKYLWVMQINYLYAKVNVLEAYIAKAFGLEALKATTTKINIELNSNIYVDDAKIAMNARRRAFNYLFEPNPYTNNPDNKFPILIGKDITDSKHSAKYYVKAIGRRENGSIIRQEMMLTEIPLIRGLVIEMSDQIISLYEKYLAKYDWVEKASQSKIYDEVEAHVLTGNVLHRSKMSLVEMQKVISTLTQLILKPQASTRDNTDAYKALMRLMELGIVEKVMRGYVCIAPKYFYNETFTEGVK